MELLKIENLNVAVENKEILKGVNLIINEGEVHAIMGPNGSGKSTLANTIMGHPKYTITNGKIYLKGTDITEMSVNERANLGLFLSFQYPAEIAGLTMSNFLRSMVNANREKQLSVVEFHKLLTEKMKELNMDKAFIRRYVNEGFSGGEKKRAEMLQMNLLEPICAVLDETDSGLDVDALKIIAEGINKLRNPKRCMLLITHYNRILHYVKPDKVHVFKDGQIIKTGEHKLAQEIEEKGYDE